MVARAIPRKLNLFAIHAHPATATDAYQSIFSELMGLEPSDRVALIGNTAVGIPEVRLQGDTYLFRVVEGTRGIEPLVLDIQSGVAHAQELEDTEVIGEATHVAVSPTNRRAAVEYVRRGAKVDLIVRSVERILRRSSAEFSRFRIEFLPVISPSFVDQIDDFQRIREARIIVSKPNAGWTDHYTEMSALLESSDGEKADVGIRASRGESLKKDTGIVSVIKNIARDHMPYLRDAKITGTRAGETAETTVPLAKHAEHRRLSINLQNNGRVSRQDIYNKLARYVAGADPDELIGND